MKNLLNEIISEALKDPQELIPTDRLPSALKLKNKLIEIHDALCNHIGDSDPYIHEDMTDEEICEEMPVFWAAKELASVIWDDQ